MILNRLEFVLMNNPLRAAVQRHFEARRFLRMGGPVRGGRAMEIGCGRGVGAEVILDVFGAATVDAFDLDPRMVAIAQRRLSSRGSQVRLWVGDAAAINAREGAYDAVFDFGIIHHVPNWRDVLIEIHRVLRPGGLLFAEEPVGGILNHPLMHRLFEHPVEDRFEAADFRSFLRAAGFILLKEEHLLHTMFWFVASKPATAQPVRFPQTQATVYKKERLWRALDSQRASSLTSTERADSPVAVRSAFHPRFTFSRIFQYFVVLRTNSLSLDQFRPICAKTKSAFPPALSP